jgi:E3 ubiquitin-protein ligase HUWE1
VRGRHLLDHEALTCLLVLLFLDENRLNTSRLHRVLRNLCYHTPTRAWIISTLLSVLQHLTDTDHHYHQQQVGQQQQSAGRSTQQAADYVPSDELPAWLNVYLCAALGSQANVFHVQRASSKRSHAGRLQSFISIHPQASPLICQHILDTLISLAKSFPNAFLPATGAELPTTSATATTDDKSKAKSATLSSPQTMPSTPPGTAPGSTDFWAILLRLESTVSGKRGGKSVQRLPSGTSGSAATDTMGNAGSSASFEGSALGQLMAMVAHPVVRRSQLLTDRLLRLLGLVSVGLTDAAAAPVSTVTVGGSNAPDTSTLQPPAAPSITGHSHLAT